MSVEKNPLTLINVNKNQKYIFKPKFIEVDTEDDPVLHFNSTNKTNTTVVKETPDASCPPGSNLTDEVDGASSEISINPEFVEIINKDDVCGKCSPRNEFGRNTLKTLLCNDTSQVSMLNTKLATDDAYFEFLVNTLKIFFSKKYYKKFTICNCIFLERPFNKVWRKGLR